jgi:hypothetical protein
MLCTPHVPQSLTPNILTKRAVLLFPSRIACFAHNAVHSAFLEGLRPLTVDRVLLTEDMSLQGSQITNHVSRPVAFKFGRVLLFLSLIIYLIIAIESDCFVLGNGP